MSKFSKMCDDVCRCCIFYSFIHVNFDQLLPNFKQFMFKYKIGKSGLLISSLV